MVVKRTTSSFKYDDNNNIIEQRITEEVNSEEIGGTLEEFEVQGSHVSFVDMIASLASIMTIIAAGVIIYKCATMM